MKRKGFTYFIIGFLITFLILCLLNIENILLSLMVSIAIWFIWEQICKKFFFEPIDEWEDEDE